MLENTQQVKSRQVVQQLNEDLSTLNEEIASTNEELAAANEELSTNNEELVQTQQHLKQSRHLLETTIEAAGIGTYIINKANRTLITSPRLKELFGYYPGEEMPYRKKTALTCCLP